MENIFQETEGRAMRESQAWQIADRKNVEEIRFYLGRARKAVAASQKNVDALKRIASVPASNSAQTARLQHDIEVAQDAVQSAKIAEDILDSALQIAG